MALIPGLPGGAFIRNLVAFFEGDYAAAVSKHKGGSRVHLYETFLQRLTALVAGWRGGGNISFCK